MFPWFAFSNLSSWKASSCNSLTVFRARDYNATIKFYRWITGRKMKVLKGSFNDKKNKEIMEFETEEYAYQMAIQGMLDWVEKNMDLEKTRVFFTSMSPPHTDEEWVGEKNGNCYNEIQRCITVIPFSRSSSDRPQKEHKRFFSETSMSHQKEE